MNGRRAGLLSALVLTAALLLSTPALLRSLRPQDENRMDESLRPPTLQMLTVWLLPGGMEDGRLVNESCAAFEKAHRGARVFLRTATAEELYAPDAVLPDVVLFETGAIAAPERTLVALADSSEPSGQFGGVCYALPVWFHVPVVSVPHSWLIDSEAPAATARPRSLLAAATAAPAQSIPAVLDDLPWERLLPSLERPGGTALMQLLHMCPTAHRALLAAEPSAAEARVTTLAKHLKDAGEGKAVSLCLLTPAVSDRVRYAALCRDGELARAFLQFLRAQSAPLTHGLLPAVGGQSEAEGLSQALEAYRVRTLPNAFAHTRNELDALCRDAFLRMADPVETLLRLR